MGIVVWKKFPLVALIMVLALYFFHESKQRLPPAKDFSVADRTLEKRRTSLSAGSLNNLLFFLSNLA